MSGIWLFVVYMSLTLLGVVLIFGAVFLSKGDWIGLGLMLWTLPIPVFILYQLWKDRNE